MHQAGIYADEIKGKVYDVKLLRRFVRYVSPYQKQLLLTLLTLPLVAACKLLQPIIVKKAIDSSIIIPNLNLLSIFAISYAGVLIAEALFSYIEVYLLQAVGQKIMADIREELYSRIIRLPVGWFDKTASGAAVTRLTSDIEALGEMFAAGIITVVADILLLAGIIAVMLSMNLRLSLATFTVLPLLAYITYSFRRRMRLSFREVRSRLAELNSSLAEAVSGVTIIQLFNREKRESDRFARLNAAYRDANMPVIFWDASLYAIVEALSAVAVSLIIWRGGGDIITGSLSFGVLVAFIQYVEKFFAPIRDLSAKYSVMQGAMASLERIFNLLDFDPEQSCAVCSQPSEGNSAAALEFRNVTFSYREGEKALDNFSLVVKKGESVALVGESGGGKTTVTRLLSRFYEIDSGDILIDGVSIYAMSLQEVRRRVAVVLQDPAIFAGSVAFNIALGNPDAESNIKKAAETVGADRFIKNLGNGYETEITERGGNLSSGEKQLISFARAIAFDPQILVLDEATANVDSSSEQMIQDGVKRLMKGRTSLVVAHRLSTIQDADKIVVLQSGTIAEMGNHQELLELNGSYSKLQRVNC